jgi:acyl-CoA synthetase (AMP-forming)/AMP-acid ligase II
VIGEIIVRGTSMTAGYWKDADLTREKIKDTDHRLALRHRAERPPTRIKIAFQQAA